VGTFLRGLLEGLDAIPDALVGDLPGEDEAGQVEERPRLPEPSPLAVVAPTLREVPSSLPASVSSRRGTSSLDPTSHLGQGGNPKMLSHDTASWTPKRSRPRTRSSRASRRPSAVSS